MNTRFPSGHDQQALLKDLLAGALHQSNLQQKMHLEHLVWAAPTGYLVSNSLLAQVMMQGTVRCRKLMHI
jgi:hypothetical protein